MSLAGLLGLFGRIGLNLNRILQPGSRLIVWVLLHFQLVGKSWHLAIGTLRHRRSTHNLYLSNM